MFEETLCWHQRQRKACQLVYRHRHGHELLLPWQERGEWEVSKDSRIRNLKTQEWVDLHVCIYVKIRGPEIHQFLTIEFYRMIYQTFEGHFGAFLTEVRCQAGAKLYVTAIACLAYGAWAWPFGPVKFRCLSNFRCLSFRRLRKLHPETHSSWTLRFGPVQRVGAMHRGTCWQWSSFRSTGSTSCDYLLATWRHFKWGNWATWKGLKTSCSPRIPTRNKWNKRSNTSFENFHDIFFADVLKIC